MTEQPNKLFFHMFYYTSNVVKYCTKNTYKSDYYYKCFYDFHTVILIPYFNKLRLFFGFPFRLFEFRFRRSHVRESSLAHALDSLSVCPCQGYRPHGTVA